MSAMEPKGFEQELRRLIDSYFDRDDLPEYPYRHLVAGTLPMAELSEWVDASQQWDLNMVLYQYSLPRLLRLCPDAEGRAMLWKVVNHELGGGDDGRSHPTQSRRFSLAIGIAEARLPLVLDANSPATRQRLKEVDALTLVELLTRFLCPEVLATKVFGAYGAALKRWYGLSAEDAAFYTEHGVEDRADSAVLLQLVCRYARTESEQESARRVLKKYFEQDRIRCLCALRPLDFNFSAAFEP